MIAFIEEHREAYGVEPVCRVLLIAPSTYYAYSAHAAVALDPGNASDRGRQYVSIRYAERLAEAGINMSVGSVGDSYDNALTETVIGFFKTEVVKHLGPWKTKGQLEWETMKWVH